MAKRTCVSLRISKQHIAKDSKNTYVHAWQSSCDFWIKGITNKRQHVEVAEQPSSLCMWSYAQPFVTARMP